MCEDPAEHQDRSQGVHTGYKFGWFVWLPERVMEAQKQEARSKKQEAQIYLILNT